MVGELPKLLHLSGLPDLQRTVGVDDCHDLVGPHVAVLEGERRPCRALLRRTYEESDFRIAHRIAVLLGVVRHAHFIRTVGIRATDHLDHQPHERRVLKTEVAGADGFKAAVLINHLLDVLHGRSLVRVQGVWSR